MSLCNNKQKALLELIELLNKGIDLLANNNLDKELYDAFKKYVQSTIKLVDAAYTTTYEFSFASNYDPLSPYRYNPFLRHNDISSSLFPQPSIMSSNYSSYPASLFQSWGVGDSKDYKPDLKILLQRLISILKSLVNEC